MYQYIANATPQQHVELHGSTTYNADWTAVEAAITTPSEALEYMRLNYTYSAHGTDVPYAPADLNSVRAGDCKDLAVAFSGLISNDGYDAHLIVFETGPNAGHVVTVYNDGTNWMVQSNMDILGPVNSVEDAIQQAAAWSLAPGTTVGSYREYPPGFTGQLAYA
jgi:hypothetical protein